MKQFFISICLFISAVLTCNAQLTLTEEASQYYYTNPIISGMNPDPSICRVGEDYYLVTSTFGFFPGIPVYHSRDLVNWELIGHGINRPEQLRFKEGQKSKLNIFAATIRYHNGIFYIITTNAGQGNIIITASNPAGPWSEAHYLDNAQGIDPSLFFDDDGKVYYTGNYSAKNKITKNARNIWLQEIDLKTWKLVGKRKDVINSNEYYAGMMMSDQGDNQLMDFMEGPHLYKKEDSYYLLASHGGTFWNHAVSIWKSNDVFGPYKINPANPIVTNRDAPKYNYAHHTGHADIVQTQQGEWFMVLLGIRPYGGSETNLGRETFMVPIDWSQTWPIINPLGPIGKVMQVHRRPTLDNQPMTKEKVRDDFDEQELDLNWNMYQIPQKQWYTLSKKGQLQIKLGAETLREWVNPHFIGRRQAHKNFTATCKMTFVPAAENEVAGLVVTRDATNRFQLLSVLKDGKHMVQLKRIEVNLGEGDSILTEAAVDANMVYFKCTALEQAYAFSYSIDGKSWMALGGNQDGRIFGTGAGIGRFTGTFIGMYASSNNIKSNNIALFDWFEYSGY